MNTNANVNSNNTVVFDINLAVENHGQPVFNLETGTHVLEAIQAIQAEIYMNGSIRPQKHTGDLNYAYRKISDIYRVISPLLAKNNIVVLPHAETTKVARTINKKGDISYKALVVMRYTIISKIDKSYVTASMVAEATDPLDKATTKATAMAHKQFYTQIFNLANDSDPELVNELNEAYGAALNTGKGNHGVSPSVLATPEQITNVAKQFSDAGYSFEAFCKKRGIVLKNLSAEELGEISFNLHNHSNHNHSNS